MTQLWRVCYYFFRGHQTEQSAFSASSNVLNNDESLHVVCIKSNRSNLLITFAIGIKRRRKKNRIYDKLPISFVLQRKRAAANIQRETNAIAQSTAHTNTTQPTNQLRTPTHTNKQTCCAQNLRVCKRYKISICYCSGWLMPIKNIGAALTLCVVCWFR